MDLIVSKEILEDLMFSFYMEWMSEELILHLKLFMNEYYHNLYDFIKLSND